MHRLRIVSISLLSAVTLLLACGACATSATQDQLQQADPSRTLVLKRRLAVLKGKEDRDNKYISTVLINRGKPEGECSGVFVSPQVVIMAAHCVCTQRSEAVRQDRETTVPDKEVQGVVDGTACADSATVEMFRYEKKVEGGGKWLSTGEFTGAVWPHEQFKILFDVQENVVWYYADLAAIVLSKPVEGISYVKLPGEEIKENTAVVTAGYGLSQIRGGTSGVRRFGTNTIKRVEKSEAGEMEVRTGPGGAQVFEGDSGGPCLNEQGDTLVGITSSYGVRGDPASFSEADVLSIFTSAYHHRVWLDKVIRQASESPKVTR
jgi:V8-like Glu-specific endopeptidase